jgi:hypothetical protein
LNAPPPPNSMLGGSEQVPALGAAPSGGRPTLKWGWGGGRFNRVSLFTLLCRHRKGNMKGQGLHRGIAHAFRKQGKAFPRLGKAWESLPTPWESIGKLSHGLGKPRKAFPRLGKAWESLPTPSESIGKLSHALGKHM